MSYVDDLISGSSTLEGIHSKADIVSAFALVFQIKLNTSKFRAFGINHGNHHSQPDDEFIVVHGPNWVPTRVPLQSDGTLVHLGSKKDFNLGDEVQFREVEHKLARALGLISASTTVSTSGKLRVVQGVVDKQIRYIASKASWKLHGRGNGASYEALDRILARGIRRITGNMASFPQRLIWADKAVGGFGINSITQSAQEDKLANMANAYKEGGARAVTMDCLVQQVMSSVGQSRVGTCTLQSVDHRETWWLTSAVQWLQEVGLTITMNSMVPELRQCQLRSLYPTLNKDEVDLLLMQNVTTVAELLMEGDADCPVFGPLIQRLGVQAWPQEPIPLQTGQV